MPTYDYVCRHCEAKTEVFQKITDAPLTLCSHCGKEELRRGFGGGMGLQFKGSGFYITDYGKSHDGSFSCCPCGKGKESCSSAKSSS